MQTAQCGFIEILKRLPLLPLPCPCLASGLWFGERTLEYGDEI
jgi:hypothetical protein